MGTRIGGEPVRAAAATCVRELTNGDRWVLAKPPETCVGVDTPTCGCVTVAGWLAGGGGGGERRGGGCGWEGRSSGRGCERGGGGVGAWLDWPL